MGEWFQRKRIRLPEYDYDTPGAYFITICVKNRHCLLSRILWPDEQEDPHIQLLPYGVIASKYLQQIGNFYPDLQLESYVIMPNHIHFILMLHETEEGPSRTPVPTLQNNTISRFISTFKRFCNKDFGKNIWQDRSYDHVIRNPEDMYQHLKYIQENPMRWKLDELYSEE